MIGLGTTTAKGMSARAYSAGSDSWTRLASITEGQEHRVGHLQEGHTPTNDSTTSIMIIATTLSQEQGCRLKATTPLRADRHGIDADALG